jgi:drug/metabolite transporter (DMT)-like permease
MLRGSVVLFTGTFSAMFLGRRHPFYRWFALCVVFLGVAVVGMSGIVEKGDPNSTAAPKDENAALLGIFFVVLAQCFSASQFVIEEKILSKYQIPALKAVGLEGLRS